MGAHRHEIEARRLLREHGAKFVRNTRHCELFEFPDGRRVGLPGSSPSDNIRNWTKALSDVRRMTREEDVSDVVDAEKPQSPIEGSPIDLAALGAYVREKVTIIEHHRREAVIPIDGFAKALGLHPDAAVGLEVRLLDVNGDQVAGPVTVSVQFDVTQDGVDEFAVPQDGKEG